MGSKTTEYRATIFVFQKQHTFIKYNEEAHSTTNLLNKQGAVYPQERKNYSSTRNTRLTKSNFFQNLTGRSLVA